MIVPGSPKTVLGYVDILPGSTVIEDGERSPLANVPRSPPLASSVVPRAGYLDTYNQTGGSAGRQ